MRVKAENWKLPSIFGLKSTSNFLSGFGKILSNFRPDPKIGVAYKKMFTSLEKLAKISHRPL